MYSNLEIESRTRLDFRHEMMVFRPLHEGQVVRAHQPMQLKTAGERLLFQTDLELSFTTRHWLPNCPS